MKHLVELHGGGASAESEGVGRGSTFTVRLPRSAEEERESVEPVAEVLPDLRDLKIVLVENDDASREMLGVALARYGAVVRSASSAAEGAMLIEDEVPDVIVTDIAMPGEDGFALLRNLRLRDVKVPVIAISPRWQHLGAEKRARKEALKPFLPNRRRAASGDLRPSDSETKRIAVEVMPLLPTASRMPAIHTT